MGSLNYCSAREIPFVWHFIVGGSNCFKLEGYHCDPLNCHYSLPLRPTPPPTPDLRFLRRRSKTWARWTTGALEKFLLFDVSLLEDQIASCVGLYMRECRSLEVLLSAYRNRYMGLVPTSHLYPSYSLWLWKPVHFFPTSISQWTMYVLVVIIHDCVLELIKFTPLRS